MVMTRKIINPINTPYIVDIVGIYWVYHPLLRGSLAGFSQNGAMRLRDLEARDVHIPFLNVVFRKPQNPPNHGVKFLFPMGNLMM